MQENLALRGSQLQTKFFERNKKAETSFVVPHWGNSWTLAYAVWVCYFSVADAGVSLTLISCSQTSLTLQPAVRHFSGRGRGQQKS